MSCDAEMEYFEGPEKTLEVWFKRDRKAALPRHLVSDDSAASLSSSPVSSAGSSPCSSPVVTRASGRSLLSQPTSCYSSMDEDEDAPAPLLVRKQQQHLVDTHGQGLRAVPRSEWERLLAAVQCTILSTTSNEVMDSYVLSESSMFITPERFILKTCGTTTLLRAVPILLGIAKSVGMTVVQDFFFSRRHLGRPELQQHPHTSFKDEVVMLDSYFEHGNAHILGRVNGDHWYLYQVEGDDDEDDDLPDQTLEIIMADLDPKVMASFYKSDTIRTVEDVHEATGIHKIFPDAKLDAYLFEPCGYSVNALIGAHYFTIHVTPQESFSYVSFETDVPMRSYTKLINQVLDIFRPGRFCLNLFSNKASPCTRNGFEDKAVKGYERRDKLMYEFKKYSLNFGHFDRTDVKRKRLANADALRNWSA